MPTPSKNQIPDPHVDFAGRNNLDSSGKNSFRRKAKLFAPENTNMEEMVSTVSRYALRLIDRVTGKAYSADELQEKITAAATVGTATIVAALGVPTYADLTAANAALAIGKIYFDTALSSLNVTTA